MGEQVADIHGPLVGNDHASDAAFDSMFAFEIPHWHLSLWLGNAAPPKLLDFAGGRAVWMEWEMEDDGPICVAPFFNGRRASTGFCIGNGLAKWWACFICLVTARKKALEGQLGASNLAFRAAAQGANTEQIAAHDTRKQSGQMSRVGWCAQVQVKWFFMESGGNSIVLC